MLEIFAAIAMQLILMQNQMDEVEIVHADTDMGMQEEKMSKESITTLSDEEVLSIQNEISRFIPEPVEGGDTTKDIDPDDLKRYADSMFTEEMFEEPVELILMEEEEEVEETGTQMRNNQGASSSGTVPNSANTSEQSDRVITADDYNPETDRNNQKNSINTSNTSKTNNSSEDGAVLGMYAAPSNNFRMHIPAIGLTDVPVLPTDMNDDEVWKEDLKQGVGQDLLYPGEGGKVVIFGHSSNYSWVDSDYNYIFKELNNVQPGNIVQLDFNGTRYVYKISKKEITGPYMPSVMTNYGREELVLFTCWPHLTSNERLIVYAEPLF